MDLFYVKPMDSSRFQGDANELKHARQSLRKKPGEMVYATTGDGQIWRCQIDSMTKDEITMTKLELEREALPLPKISIAIAPTKQMSRIEDMFEKCCEIGIAEFFLIQTDHSIRNKVRMDRLERIMLAAMKQSWSARTVKIHPIQSLADCLTHTSDQQQLIASQQAHQSLRNVQYTEKTVIFIGPEGDFSKREYQIFEQAELLHVLLSSNRLRTETAGLVALTQASIPNI